MEQTNQQRTFLGQPLGLFYLFFAELWERFSFYGMRALLVLYMTKQLLFTDDMSFGVYAAYMSLVYFTPIIGGVISDNYLGYRKAITLGGVFMAIGHFMLAVETPVFFFGALAIIIVGNGLFKPNISTFVGRLYEEGDERRDSGFTIFYMGINIGGAVAPLLCAWVAEVYGWHYGFGLAGIGMLIGLLAFRSGIANDVFGNTGLPPKNSGLQTKYMGISKEILITLACLLSVPLFALVTYNHEYEHYMVWIAALVIVFILIKIYQSVEQPYKSRLLVIAYFTILMSLFWAIFEQAGSSLTLFADRNVNLIGMNAAQTNSINGFFIIVLAIPFSILWQNLTDRNINPNSAIKAGLGLILLGLGFVVFALSARDLDLASKTPMMYLVLGYFILTIGELFISPIGLSKVSELSPAKYLSFLMGVFFTSSFFGHFFAGKISKLTDISTEDSNPFFEGFLGDFSRFITGLDAGSIAGKGDELLQLYSYTSVYAVFGLIAIMVGGLALLISPLIKKWMAGVN